MRKLFHEELKDLDKNFTDLGNKVSTVVSKSVDAFINHDRDEAQEIIDRDYEINETEAEIEKKTFEMIALYQPVTVDLRSIVTILKSVSVLERMADQARNIAQAAIRVKGTRRSPKIEKEIANMGKLAATIVDQVLKMYFKFDSSNVEQVVNSLDKINEIGNNIRKMSISEMKKNSDYIDSASYYIVIASYIKRVSDYAVDIAEWTIYKRTGKIVELNPQGSVE